MKFRIREVKGLPGARAMRNALGRETAERMKYSASRSAEKTFALLGCDRGGLSEEKAEVMRKCYGANVIQAADRKSAFTRLAEAFVNPFSAMAKGSVAMSRKKVIVKRMHAIQNLGAADILCTDKTGTLTQDKVVLERHMNVHGEDMRQVFVAVFRAGWFIESMWTQTLIIHFIRTPKLPFIKSRASRQVTALTAAGIAVLTVIPFTPLGGVIGLAAPPAQYFALLAVVVAAYMALVTFVKRLYLRRFGELL